jgi:hypothetical protein
MRFPVWRNKRHQQLEHEIETHLQMARRDHLDRGESAQQADSAARREFGNVALVQHATSDQWGWLWLEELLRIFDMAHAWCDAIRDSRSSPCSPWCWASVRTPPFSVW